VIISTRQSQTEFTLESAEFVDKKLYVLWTGMVTAINSCCTRGTFHLRNKLKQAGDSRLAPHAAVCLMPDHYGIFDNSRDDQ
jgi:hypothetical protein